MNAIHLTTPIYYVNSDPHLGHAYTAILADVLSRFHRQRGFQTRFTTGTDEHGEKIEQSASRNGLSPQAFTDQVSERFRTLWPSLLVEHDDFIRTTEARHKSVVSAILSQLYEAGEIYKGEYRGLYCTGCERFLTDKDLIQGKCPDHGVAPREVIEENYLFRMEKHRLWLKETLEQQPSLLEPERYRNEVLAILREPIGDLSISRPASRVSWGIPMPFDPSHVVYVWFDALFNYVSALGGPGAPDYERLWTSTVHIMAKDIVKQHGIFWPIMLRAAGLPLFKGLRVHGYWLMDHAKMSKSLGNVIKPLALKDTYGIDALRYFLCRDMGFGSDADFSELGLAQRLNSDLANDLGNLLSRVLTMISRACEGKLPPAGTRTPAEQTLVDLAHGLADRFDGLMAAFQLNMAIEEVLQVVRKANQYIHEAAPWSVAKDPSPEAQARVGTILHHAAEVLRLAAVLLAPVIPQKSLELLAQLGCDGAEVLEGPAGSRAWGALPVGATIQPGAILFPKVDLEALKKSLLGSTEAAPPPKPAKIKPSPKSNPSAQGEPSASTTASSHAAAQAASQQAAVSTAASTQESVVSSSPEGNSPALIGIDDFAKVQLRVAEVLAVEPVPKAKKLLKLTLALSSEQRTVVSGIAEHYSPEALVGKKVVVVANLKPVVLRGVESQGMILAAEDAEGKLSLVTLDRDLPSGGTVR